MSGPCYIGYFYWKVYQLGETINQVNHDKAIL